MTQITQIRAAPAREARAKRRAAGRRATIGVESVFNLWLSLSVCVIGGLSNAVEQHDIG
jgi:hypothetical protein